jgi:hypothetical protein
MSIVKQMSRQICSLDILYYYLGSFQTNYIISTNVGIFIFIFIFILIK